MSQNTLRNPQDVENEYHRLLKEATAKIDGEFDNVQSRHASEVGKINSKYAAERQKSSQERDAKIRRIDADERNEISQAKRKAQGERAKATAEHTSQVEDINSRSYAELRPHNDAISEAKSKHDRDLAAEKERLKKWLEDETKRVRDRMIAAEDAARSAKGPLGSSESEAPQEPSASE